VLIAALALVALPGLAGSRVPNPIEPLPASAFQPLSVSANSARSTVQIDPLDAAHAAAGAVTDRTSFIEAGTAPEAGLTDRPDVNQPEPGSGSVQKPPRYTLTGTATFYDNGTTAMRLPRGTVVKICGKGGCIVRVVNDYGPQKKSRVVDLYRPDFFAVCGCGSWEGVTNVTVYVY
jgi:3D (Asp-Asp-Asp) domain-containing protein